MLGDPALGARGLVRVSPVLWSDPQWLCSDLRRSALYRTSGSPVNAIYTVKYRDYANSSDAAPMIRYAEVLLMLAEAEARQAAGTTVSTRGVALLNAVRNRAVTTPADQFTVASFADKNALISAILKEELSSWQKENVLVIFIVWLWIRTLHLLQWYTFQSWFRWCYCSYV